jgi:hypothetical protein
MKRVIGLFAAILILSLPVWAQHPGGGDHSGGGGHPPAPMHGPEPYHGAPQHTEQNRNFRDAPGTLMLLTFMTTATGSGTIRDETIRTTISIIPLSMGISTAGLDRRMSGICTEVDRTASFLAASTSAWLLTIWTM